MLRERKRENQADNTKYKIGETAPRQTTLADLGVGMQLVQNMGPKNSPALCDPISRALQSTRISIRIRQTACRHSLVDTGVGRGESGKKRGRPNPHPIPLSLTSLLDYPAAVRYLPAGACLQTRYVTIHTRYILM